jgi:O-antigen/teichoic acid export membrane protein
MSEISRKNIFSNLIWKYAEKMSAHIVTFIIQIVLARILTPEDFGLIALILVFTNILEVFADSGLANALIQKKASDDVDFSTVFFTNLGVSLLLYIVMFVCAPYIETFYGKPNLTVFIRVLSLSVIISGIKNVQQAYVSKNLIFKKFFYATLIGTICSAVLAIYFANHGYGAWAIVIQILSNQFIDTLVLWFIVRWRPYLVFSKERLKFLFSFGWKLLASALLDRGYNNMRQLIIGKMYMPVDLAYYNRGEVFPLAAVANINSSIDSVIFPVMSRFQDDLTKLKKITRKSIKMGIYIMAPLMIGMSASADNIVSILLTDKWLPCVPYLRIFCITYMFWPVHTANLNAIKALGRSDIFLRLEIYKKVVGIFLLLLTMWHSVIAMAYSLLVSCITSQIINTYPNKKILHYSYCEQLKDFLPEIIISVIMGVIVYLFNLLPYSSYVILGIQVFVGILFYILASKILKLESYSFLVSEVRSIFCTMIKK